VAIAYADAGTPIPSTAYVRNDAAFPDPLPELPTFADAGISLEGLQSGGDTLTPEESAAATQVRDQINAELATLRTQFATLEAQGYHVVPDMDRAQFSWVKEVQ
jgi:hypothetical protein